MTDDDDDDLPVDADAEDDDDAGDDAGDDKGASAAKKAGAKPVDAEHLRLLEALLFASVEPLNERRIAARLPEGADVKELLKVLRAQYAGRGVNLRKAGQGWAFRTADDVGPMLERERTVSRKLSRAAVETLAIIAYHQPVTKSEIEEVRGVSLSTGTFDTLCEAGWVKPLGRRETLGYPMQWGTADGFLDHFGLERINDLPGRKDLEAMGLLDSGPALDAYRARGDMAPAQPEDAQSALDLAEAEADAEAASAPLTPFENTDEAAGGAESEDSPPWRA
ncbi:MAG: SMC-Scp complex subunit ScpB [Rhodospirillales bacterium]